MRNLLLVLVAVGGLTLASQSASAQWGGMRGGGISIGIGGGRGFVGSPYRGGFNQGFYNRGYSNRGYYNTYRPGFYGGGVNRGWNSGWNRGWGGRGFGGPGLYIGF